MEVNLIFTIMQQEICKFAERCVHRSRAVILHGYNKYNYPLNDEMWINSIEYANTKTKFKFNNKPELRLRPLHLSGQTSAPLTIPKVPKTWSPFEIPKTPILFEPELSEPPLSKPSKPMHSGASRLEKIYVSSILFFYYFISLKIW